MQAVKKQKVDFVHEHGKGVSFDKFFEEFREDDGLDLFYVGVSSIDISYIPACQTDYDQRDGEDNDDNDIEVKPAFNDMILQVKRRRQ